MANTEQLEAELEVVRLEEQLKEAKTKKGGPSRELKEELRVARQTFREARAGDGVASPETVAASTDVKE